MTERISLFAATACALFFVTAAVVFAAPFAEAQGLVPMCGSGPYDSGIYCQLCHLMDLFNNVIQYGVTIAVSIGAALFAYAGYLFFTAGGDKGKIDTGKKIFKNVLFGFLIAVTGVLLVDTVVKAVAAKGFKWDQVRCEQGRVLTGGLKFETPKNDICENSASPQDCQEQTGGVPFIIGSGNCSEEAMGRFAVSERKLWSCLCAKESGGQNLASGVDVLWGVPLSTMPANVRADLDARKAMPYAANSGLTPFSFGTFQINITQHDISCGNVNLPCTSAFKLTDTGSRERESFIKGGLSEALKRQSPVAQGKAGYGYEVTNWDLYNQCANAALDHSCNLAYAQKLTSGRDQMAQHWSVSYQQCASKGY